MKHILMIVLLVLVASTIEAKALIGPQLEVMLSKARAERIEVMIVMNEQSDEEYLAKLTADLPRREKRYPVIEELKKLSARTQGPVLERLNNASRDGKVSDITSFWILNAIYCKATPEVIEAVGNIEGVEYIESSNIISENILLTKGQPVPVDVLGSRTVEWNIRRVAADSCWALGYKGQGIVVGIIDTGCNYNHLDLASHMWSDVNYPNHGWNFELNNNNPMDVNGHGTHCSGTIASNGTAGDSCGMAPQCSLMVCRVRTSLAYPMPDTISEANVFGAIQFVISPPLSPTHGADAVSMSLGWYLAWTPRRSWWRKAVTNVALAGMPYFIAAGNEQGSTTCPIPYNLRCPGDVPPPWHNPSDVKGRLGGAISIAATDNTDAIASFSSIGPSCWENVPEYWDYPYRPGLGLRKPDIAAPGVNITSCAYNNNSGYISGYSGTSMATPHCAGLAALLLSKNPNLTVAQVDSIIQFTALDLGPAGKDTVFGAGRIRARRAIDNTPASGAAIDLRIAEQGTVVLDPAPTGNNNSFFEPSERITLVDTLVNVGTLVANNVTGILRTTTTNITIVDSMASYGNINPKARGNNGADPFVLRADTFINLGTIIPLELRLTSGTYTKTLNFQLRMGSVCGPDSLGYFILDNSDSLYTESPVYNWIEINPGHGGSGTSIGTGGANVTFRIPLPFVFRHYSKRFGTTDSVSVCSNGWISFGRSTLTVQHNSFLPKIRDYGSQATATNMVAGYWDTLYTGSPGSWWRYYDAANRRYIIEYDSVGPNTSSLQVFEFILYDSTTAGPGLRNDIIVQYKRAINPTSCTVGQQDSSKMAGWTYLFDKVYDIGAPPIENLRAIKFTTKQPRMKAFISADEFKEYPNMGSHPIVLAPNPAHKRINIFYNISSTGRASLKIYNSVGQLVKTIFDEKKGAGVYTTIWDGRDNYGRKVSSGVYFYHLEVNGESYSERGVIVR